MKRRLLSLGILLCLVGSGFAQQPSAAPAPHSAHAPSEAKPSADKVWANLIAGNKRFIAGKPQVYALASLRRELTAGQSPHVIVLSCSDSRVSPELTFDQSLGDLFVVRTAGNVADQVALGSIEYAVDHFHSPLFVVLGHKKCGAVIAACSGEKMPSANLESIMNKIGPAVAKVKTYPKVDDFVESVVEENVHQSAENVLANSEIIRNAVKAGKLTVIEAEYEFDTGEVVRLNPPAGGQN
jgi:carbonic anhydrase